MSKRQTYAIASVLMFGVSLWLLLPALGWRGMLGLLAFAGGLNLDNQLRKLRGDYK